MGVSLAAWGDELKIHGNVTTGHLDLIFIDVSTFGSQPGPVSADIWDQGKRITISVEDAHENDVYKLDYTIENKGSLPVKFDIALKSSDPALRLVNTLPQKAIEPGESLGGKLRIKVGKGLEEFTEYGLSVELYFNQWNRAN